MKKTSVYLEHWLDRDLRLIAEAEGMSKAEVIREALAQRAMEAAQPRITSIGVGKGGPTDLSQNVDRYLEGFGED
jgi:Ribbon-helix-helix protein, copG family